MIPDRDKKLARMRLDAGTYGGMFPGGDITMLLDEIERLEKALEAEQARNKVLKSAMQGLEASQSVMQGVRNQMQARINELEKNEPNPAD